MYWLENWHRLKLQMKLFQTATYLAKMTRLRNFFVTCAAPLTKMLLHLGHFCTSCAALNKKQRNFEQWQNIFFYRPYRLESKWISSELFSPGSEAFSLDVTSLSPLVLTLKLMIFKLFFFKIVQIFCLKLWNDSWKGFYIKL